MRTEGVNYAVPPLVYLHLTVKTSKRQITLLALSGEPVFPYYWFRKAALGGISAGSPTVLHQPTALWQEMTAYLFPSMRWEYPIKSSNICQVLSYSCRFDLIDQMTTDLFHITQCRRIHLGRKLIDCTGHQAFIHKITLIVNFT